MRPHFKRIQSEGTMGEPVKLGIEVDTSQVVAATEALNNLAAAADRAVAALKKLGSTPVSVIRAGDLEHMTIGEGGQSGTAQ
jgi:hypothetical protein